MGIIQVQVNNNEMMGQYIEKVICEIYNIPYNTTRDYDFIDPSFAIIYNDIKENITTVLEEVCEHIGHKNLSADFLKKDGYGLGVKTYISDNFMRLCPSMGQPSLNTLNRLFGTSFLNYDMEVKQYIYDNIASIAQYYLDKFLEMDQLIFDLSTGRILYFMRSNYQLVKEKLNFKKDVTQWNESCILQYGNTNFMEIQQHSRGRKGYKFRFFGKALEEILADNLKYVQLQNIYSKKKRTLKTLNYIGSKNLLLPFLKEVMENYMQKQIKNIHSFGDLFSGTGSISQWALQEGCTKVISNDVQFYAFIWSSNLLLGNLDITKLYQLINSWNEYLVSVIIPDKVEQIDFVLQHYSEPSNRKYFTPLNAFKIDKTRQWINRLYDEKIIQYDEKNILIKILLQEVCRVSNISCVYGAFLKEYKTIANSLFQLRTMYLDQLIINDQQSHQVCNQDVLSLILQPQLQDIECIYLDPPYNSRRYDNNYHVLETIAKYDYPILKQKSKTGLRENTSFSNFCSKTLAQNLFDNLFRNLNCKYLFTSYNSEGILSKEEMTELLSKYRRNVCCFEINHKKFKAQQKVKEKLTIEYLFASTYP